MRHCHAAFLAIALLLATSAGVVGARATPLDGHDCYSTDIMRRIEGCTEILAMPGLAPSVRSHALALRALALSLVGRYNEAIADYDKALTIDSGNPVTLNNRAWALYKMGRISEALPDVEKSLSRDSTSQHAYDTRAHVRQARGEADQAYRDYRQAMKIGGSHMVRLYQCGLQAHGFYQGPVSGIYSASTEAALRACVKTPTCDPLPPDEECKAALS